MRVHYGVQKYVIVSCFTATIDIDVEKMSYLTHRQFVHLFRAFDPSTIIVNFNLKLPKSLPSGRACLNHIWRHNQNLESGQLVHDWWSRCANTAPVKPMLSAIILASFNYFLDDRLKGPLGSRISIINSGSENWGVCSTSKSDSIKLGQDRSVQSDRAASWSMEKKPHFYPPSSCAT